MEKITAYFSGLGRILALIALILTIVWLAIGKLEVVPLGVLFLALELALLI